jgi:hypothetical protein
MYFGPLKVFSEALFIFRNVNDVTLPNVAQDSILAQANLENQATECDNNYLRWYYVTISIFL